MKGRSGATDHALYDSVRGTTLDLVSNSTAAETTQTTGLTTFGAAGFTVGALAKVNTSAATYIGWNWKAGGTAVSNTAGTITSSVSANTTAGFSVVTYTGNGSASATVGHGLGVIPGMVITKGRSSASEWMVKHQSLPTGQNLILNQTLDAPQSLTFSGGVIANLTSNATFGFTIGSSSVNNANSSGVTYVAYCWAPVAGYSAFGSYTGNGSTDGPFVYTGFRPRWLMIKSSSGAFNWFIEDASRNTTNVTGLDLSPNLSDAEANNSPTFDFLSNGFKLRNTYTSQNGSGATYIYAAFAENPLKYANAR
jgi:hypothetical protein